MAKCVRCGKDIDVIVREPEKVFYCRKCSSELMKIVYNEKVTKKKVKLKNYIKYLFCFTPGLYQILGGEYTKGLVYFFGTAVLAVFWFLMIYFQFEMGIVNIKVKGLMIMFSVFIIINTMIIYLANLLEILEEKNEDIDLK